MPYITVFQSPIFHQLTFEDIMSGKLEGHMIRSNETNTRTYWSDYRLPNALPADKMANVIWKLEVFVDHHRDLYEADRQSLYDKFFIPKKSGGLREINAPKPPLMAALNELRCILENDLHALYHTAAFAYIPGRCTVDAVKKHQQNNSRWFLKVDFHDFFGSTTKEFTLRTLARISPFNLLMEVAPVKELLSKAIDLCFLNGGLPQGTPISPMLTNLLMIPIDYDLTRKLRDFDGKQLVYTRYADDMLISGFQSFDYRAVQQLIREVIASHGAPYTFKEEKTRYGSRAGSNWNLGVMLNKDNKITVGHRNKKHFRAMLNSFILDTQHGTQWEQSDVMSMNGLLSYYRMIERDYFDALIKSINAKMGVDVEAMIAAALS